MGLPPAEVPLHVQATSRAWATRDWRPKRCRPIQGSTVAPLAWGKTAVGSSPVLVLLRSVPWFQSEFPLLPAKRPERLGTAHVASLQPALLALLFIRLTHSSPSLCTLRSAGTTASVI